MLFMRKKEGKVIEVLKQKVSENRGQDMKFLSIGHVRSSSVFTVASDGSGLQVQQLSGYVLEWEHFQSIVEKANELGGVMVRGDVIAQGGGRLGEELSYDCMEGFIADQLLNTEAGKRVTRRSTYYSGILAWAGIVTLHKDEGRGSYITVNPAFRNI